jgi:toxin ParE1/3/4
MSLRFVYGHGVEEDIDSAYAWYEGKRSGLGQRFLGELDVLLQRIQDNPEMYGVIYRNVRAVKIHHFPYVVYYRLKQDRIEIVAIEHGHRNPNRWKARL